jgi:hypothetical protein
MQDQPVGTMFHLFSLIVDHLHPPIFALIAFEWDMDKRRARLEVPNVVHQVPNPFVILSPIRNTALTVLPEGFTFYEAEVASGVGKSMGVDLLT